MMIRARATQRTAPYVCATCRQKLLSSRIGPSSRAPWTIRHLSTSTTLLAANDDEKPRATLGAFGAGNGSSFGAFARKAPQSIAKVAGDGLLPHERLARQNTPAAPKPPPPPPPPRRQTQDKGRVDRSSQAERSSSSNKRDSRANNQPRRDGQGSGKAERAKSLSDLFQSERKPLPPQTPASWATGEASAPQADLKEALRSPKKSMVDRSKPHWGSFRDRRVETSISTSRTTPASVSAPKYEKPSKQTTENFWNAFEDRVSAAESDTKKKKAPLKDGPDRWGGMAGGTWGGEAKATPSYKPWAPTVQEKEDQRTETSVKEPLKGRRSRFEEEQELAGQTRDKGGKKGRNERRGRSRDMDEMEDDAELWDRKQSRRAEKRARKAAQAEAPIEDAARPILIPEFINVAALSRALQQKTASFLSDLAEMGFENITEDTIMTGETAALIAMEYGFEPTVDDGATRDLRPRPPPEDVSVLPGRPPVVTIMGHVDHGKTTLLDYLRKSSVAAQEHGGITQHIGAFVVQMSSGKTITFLDTPGHAAFLSMRQRGANVTDIVVLVVAADDSVKPQTLEALKHATAAKVPIIVAINKVDKEDARIDQVKADLSRHGVKIEDYGGDVQVVCVSGKTGQGMADLEENIVTLSEVLDVRAETDGMAEGWILESSVKQVGKAATVLVKRGTLRPGDLIVAGTTFCRIRALRNEAGIELEEAPPGTPVEITGWRDLPEAGQQILQAPDESKARAAVEYRQDLIDREQSSKQLAEQEQRQREEEAAAEQGEQEVDIEGEAAGKEKEGGILMQNFVVRADVAGSVEAVVGSIMEQGNNQVRGRVLRSSAGQITESDVDHAADTKSIIVNFNNPIMPHIKDRANQAKVTIIDQSVIYHLLDDVRDALAELLPPLVSHRVTGEADVAQTFDINLTRRVYRKIAGCKVRNGSIKRNSMVKILRGGKVIYDGKIDTLKHVKKDVAEMGKGTECGIGFEDFQDLKQDDQIQTYEIIEEKGKL
ncbi:hypothetical protein NLU13_8426 [Sarocladium strictum]|uniref:Translation initiation factor IF-2, mitochondrial n=1 Tax=Sarocladium strictum TaxID=5046 RepID=A0AA39GD47_SARSR|nr:hypothetical protein NLU13_8426 [Sarocladium strictum]